MHLQQIAFFDFDGTITRHDSMLAFTRFYKGRFRYYAGMFILLPWLLGYKLKIRDAKSTKEKFLTYFFKGEPETVLNKKGKLFCEVFLPKDIRPAAMESILNHKKNNHRVVVVSASAKNWIGHWCDAFDIPYLCSELEVQGGMITGKLKGNNCNGPEKERRIKENFTLSSFSKIYCYGDSEGDKEMMELADERFYKHF